MYAGYISEYKQLSPEEREKYKRIALLRYNAKINCLSVRKLNREDKYCLYNKSGYRKICTLDEAEALLKNLKSRYFAAKS